MQPVLAVSEPEKAVLPSDCLIKKDVLGLMSAAVPEPCNAHLLISLCASIRTREPVLVQHYALGITVDSIHPFIEDLRQVVQVVNPFITCVNVAAQEPQIGRAHV